MVWEIRGSNIVNQVPHTEKIHIMEFKWFLILNTYERQIFCKKKGNKCSVSGKYFWEDSWSTAFIHYRRYSEVFEVDLLHKTKKFVIGPL